MAEKAYAERLKIHGPEHLATIESYELVEYLGFGNGRQSLAFREKLFGKGHPEIAPSLMLMAGRRGREGAEKCVRDAMRLFQKINQGHSELAEAWTLLGRIQRLLDNAEDAGQTLEHALKHWEKIDPKHPRAARALAELAKVRSLSGDVAEADKLFGEALKRHFSDLDDDDLCKHFAYVLEETESDLRFEDPQLNHTEAYLTEMMRRGGSQIEKALAKHSKELTKKRQVWKDDFKQVPRNLEVVTALRRLQKKPDPIAVIVNGPAELEAIFPNVPDFDVALVNADEKRTPLGYMSGGNYRGGRQERWRLDVRDAKGRLVPLQHWDGDGGGIFGYSLLKPGQKWHTTLKARNFVDLIPGNYKLRVQYHDSDEIAGLNWLEGRIVCQSREIPLHIQPRVIQATSQDKKAIGQLLKKLDLKGEVKVLAGAYSKDAHSFIPPDSPAGRVLSFGWKAVPQMIDECLNEATPPRQRAWMLALLHSITTYHSPAAREGVLPAFIMASPGWVVRSSPNEAMGNGGTGWSEPQRLETSKIVLSNQLEFARRWEDFRKHLVVRPQPD